MNRLDGVSARLGGVLARLGGVFAQLGGVFARLDATLPARDILRGSSRANTPIRIQDGRFALPPSVHTTQWKLSLG